MEYYKLIILYQNNYKLCILTNSIKKIIGISNLDISNVIPIFSKNDVFKKIRVFT